MDFDQRQCVKMNGSVIICVSFMGSHLSHLFHHHVPLKLHLFDLTSYASETCAIVEGISAATTTSSTRLTLSSIFHDFDRYHYKQKFQKHYCWNHHHRYCYYYYYYFHPSLRKDLIHHTSLINSIT